MGSLDTLSGIEFERLISVLLERMGFCAAMTKASGDGGVDVVATLDRPLVRGRYLIQCKRYAPDCPVGAAAVREFYGALTADRNAVKGILITTSGFTAQALEFAQGSPVELIARDGLQRLLAEYGLSPDGVGPRGAIQSLSPGERARTLIDNAMSLHDRGNNADAIKLLREATELDGDNFAAWHWLGVCYFFVGLFDDQVVAAWKAVQLKPDDPQAWHWLGLGLYRTGEMEGAVAALEKSNAISENAHTWFELGLVYAAKGDDSKAGLAFENAAAAMPESPEPWLALGRSRYLAGLKGGDKGKFEEALKAIRDALRIDPDNAEGWYYMCVLQRESGDYRGVDNSLARLEQLDPARARKLQHDFRIGD